MMVTIDQTELDRELRIKTLLTIVDKKKELYSKLAALEKLEKEFDQFDSPEWFTSAGYLSQINDI